MTSVRTAIGLIALSVLTCVPALADTISFEGVSDSVTLTNQYSGLTFSNALVLSAGISLNEFEFPPHSGINAAADNGGPMLIAFASDQSTIKFFLTYSQPVTVTALTSGNVVVATARSIFDSNLALSGSAGSAPNELFQVSGPSDISRLVISGDPSGFSFVLDDLSFSASGTTPIPSAVPEPQTGLLVLTGSLLAFGFATNRKLM